MAGRGTGLPGAGDPGVTPLVDMTRSAGSAEAATAEALFTVGRVADQAFQTYAMPRLAEKAQQEAEADVAAGVFRERTAITPVGEAYNEAMRRGTAAREATRAETVIDELFAAHRYDPEGFQGAAAEARSAFLESVPSALAMELGAAWDQRAAGQIGRIREARAGRDLQAAQGDIEARNGRLIEEAIAGTQGMDLTAAFESAAPALAEIAANLDVLTTNPAFGIGEEQAEALQREARQALYVGVIGNEATRLLQTEGADAALAFTQGILTDEALPLSPAERQAAFDGARLRVNQQVAIDQQRLNMAQQQEADNRRRAAQMIEEDAASIFLTGEPSDITEDEVRALGGQAAVADWIRSRADAYEFRNAFPDLGEMAPDEFAQRLAEWQARPGGSGGGGSATEGYTGALDFVLGQEGSAFVADDNGAGRSQFGITERSHPEAWRDGRVTREEAEAIYRAEYWDALDLDNVAPDLALVVFDAAVNGGVGHARDVLNRSGGDLNRALDLRRQHYRRIGGGRNARFLNGWLNRVDAVGRAADGLAGGGDAWARGVYERARAQYRDDPGAYVARDFPVRAAAEALQAAEGSEQIVAREAYVGATLAAQEARGISQGDRRTLPRGSLLELARGYARFQASGDFESARAYADSVVMMYGEHGERVWRDVLRIQGTTEYAAMVSAAAQRASATGTRPPGQREVREAQRGQSVQAAAEGTPSVRQMSDEDVLRAAGLQ